MPETTPATAPAPVQPSALGTKTNEVINPATQQPFQPLGRPEAASPAFADPEKARAFQTAEHLLKSGISPERVREAMAADGYEDWAPDTRSADQKVTDRQHGFSGHDADPALYRNWQVPAGAVAPGDFAAQEKMTTELASVAAGLSMNVNDGSALCLGIAREIAELNQVASSKYAEERGEKLADRQIANEKRLAQIFPDETARKEAIALVTKVIDNLKLPNKELAKQLKPSGILGSNPAIFLRFHAQGLRFQSYAERSAKP
jgi:hypothetical protein